MSLDKFLIGEIVNISDGNTARVKNYYSANNFVVLHAHSKNDIASIKPGMTITGQSSRFSKTLTKWEHSTLKPNDIYDIGFNTYEWQAYQDRLIGSDAQGLIVLDETYNMYPRDILGGPYANLNLEILDLQLQEGIILDN